MLWIHTHLHILRYLACCWNAFDIFSLLCIKSSQDNLLDVMRSEHIVYDFWTSSHGTMYDSVWIRCCTNIDIDRHMAHIIVLISCFLTICTRTLEKCALRRHTETDEKQQKKMEMHSWHTWCRTQKKNYNPFRLFIFHVALVQCIHIYISIWICCERQKNVTKM